MPGYKKLLKAFLIELKRREIVELPEAMKEALLTLTYNESVINVMIVILFNNSK